MTDFAAKSARIVELRAKGAPVSYQIEINEAQRVALLNLIADNAGRPGFEALEYWTDMLIELPEGEAASPGCIHGFCL